MLFLDLVQIHNYDDEISNEITHTAIKTFVLKTSPALMAERRKPLHFVVISESQNVTLCFRKVKKQEILTMQNDFYSPREYRNKF